VLDLVIEGITLHFFNTGVGVLTYNLTNINPEQSKELDILKINEFGRRIYPQFLNNKGLLGTKQQFLANSIKLVINELDFSFDDFSWFNIELGNPSVSEPYRLPRLIKKLFHDEFIFKLNENETLKSPKILITKVTDDRMFFQCWYGNNENANQIGLHFKQQAKIKSDWWYAYIFGDKALRDSIANKKMQAEQLEYHTYKRWAEYGTIYGMSRDSFVCLSDEGSFSYDLVRRHMQSMYYTISILCLVQRATILKFTAEVANIADLAKIKENDKVIENIKDVYRNYIEFINKLYFREITPQIQGIEIYTQFQKILNIENEVKDLDKEISELHEYVSLLQGDERNRQAGNLNIIATVFLFATLMFGILGANIYDDKAPIFKGVINWTAWIWIGIGFIPSALALVYLLRDKIKLKNYGRERYK
jgi:hypothetical protein